MGDNHQLFESVFKRNLAADDAKDFLAVLTKEHPYFTMAQFYLLQKTDTGSSDYDDQLAKTAILFNNPFWLNFQLNQFAIPAKFQDQDLGAGGNINDSFYDTEIKKLENVDTPKESGETIVDDDELIASDQDVDQEAVVEEMKEPLLDGSLTDETGQTVLTPGIINDPENNTENGVENGDELMAEKEIAPLNFKLDISNPDTTEDTISFEPLYTSDYFASVGIKINEEIKPGDKLGKQLKSFTDWLKTMKKVHPDQLPKQSEQSDIIIQQMAEKSNSEGEILTETMAEVLLQQGKAGKAIEVYKKLSLLNPAKSAYFAAKIDQIER